MMDSVFAIYDSEEEAISAAPEPMIFQDGEAIDTTPKPMIFRTAQIIQKILGFKKSQSYFLDRSTEL